MGKPLEPSCPHTNLWVRRASRLRGGPRLPNLLSQLLRFLLQNGPNDSEFCLSLPASFVVLSGCERFEPSVDGYAKAPSSSLDVDVADFLNLAVLERSPFWKCSRREWLGHCRDLQMRTIAQAALAACGPSAIKERRLWPGRSSRHRQPATIFCHNFVILGQNHVFDGVVSFDVVDDVLVCST